MNELDVQRGLCIAGNELGGHCFKSSNRFLKGVLDLSVQLPGLQHSFIEVKFERKFIQAHLAKRTDLSRGEVMHALRGEKAVHLKLTPHQRRFMTRELQSGGSAGWLMVVARGNGEYVMDCSCRIPSHGVLYYDDHWLFKKRGGKWPIRQIVERLQIAVV